MVAGPSSHSSAYAAGDRLACRRAATHRWLSPWGWRRWRRWSRPASCWRSRSTGRRAASSTPRRPSWAGRASSRSSRRARVGSSLPAVPGHPRPSRRPAAGPPAAGSCPRVGVPRRRAAAPARSWPCRAARRARSRSRSSRRPPSPGPAARSGEAPTGGVGRRVQWRVALPRPPPPGREQPPPLAGSGPAPPGQDPALAGPGRARAPPVRPGGPPAGQPRARLRPALGRVPPPQPSTHRQNGWPAGSR